jgi:glycosyltransferase involved in cell wall biosynthesis
MKTIALTMIIRNEESNLPRCLESVKNVADEIIIVDTGSTDNSIEIAKKFNAKIYNFVWANDFSAARNKALELVQSEWILHLDADESLSKESQSSIPDLIYNTTAGAVALIVRNYQSDQDMVKFLDDRQIRLFKNHAGYRYEQPVHEQISPSILRNNGSVENSHLVIEHYGYMDDPVIKAKRNLPILEHALQKNPADAYLNFKMGETLKALDRLDMAKYYLLNVFSQNYKLLPAELIDTLWMRLGQIELANNNYSQVLKYCLESLKINPKNTISIYVLSIALIYLQEYDRALIYLEKIRQLNWKGVIDAKDVEKLYSVCATLKKQVK